MNDKAVNTLNIVRITDGEVHHTADTLAIEEPLEVQLSYFSEEKEITKKISVTMRTPGNDAELGAGFLFTEGILKSRSDIDEVMEMPEGNTVVVRLSKGLQPQLQNTERNFYTTSSCGVCGKSSIDAIKTVSVFTSSNDDLKLQPDIIYGLPDKLRQQQEVFESTGGLHASALFNFDGTFLDLREDVGRHNALDKVIGAALLNNQLPLSHCILLLSGRASFELVQKAHMAGIKVIAAVGAPSSLAVSLAEESGITLIGFLRGARFNIYSHNQRVIFSPQGQTTEKL
jgi:FdhD protein